MTRIQDLPLHDRPRERLQAVGARALSDIELLSVMLGRGCRGKDVQAVAADVLKVIDRSDIENCFSALSKIAGIGAARATQLIASLEFFRRRIRPEGLKIKFPADILLLLSHYADRKQEHFIVVSVSGASEVIATRCVAVGLVDSAPVHPREIFADPIVDRAAAVILAHNHPNGDEAPSQRDIEITKELKAAGETLKIGVLDHIVFTKRGFYSFLEHGQI
jgi:DNA repair protein RadC